MKQIQVNIKLPSQTDLDKQLNDLIAKLKDKKIDLAINTKAFTTSLKEMESALGSLKTKLKDFDILSNATKGASNAKKDIQDISNLTGDLSKQTNKFDAMGNLISSTKTFKDTFIQTTKVMSDGTSTVTQDFNKLNNKIADMQSKLNTASSNNLINPSVIENLQNKLNNINTNTAESEIKELQTTINNLSSNDSGIVRLQNAINNLQNNLKNTRGKYGSLVDLNDLKNTTSEIDNLKNTLREVTNGKTIDSGRITSEINKANSSFKTLQTNAKTSGEALRVAQQDATSFGSAVSRAFANSGIFLTTATAIRAVTNELKNASSYIIELDERLTNIQMITGKSSSAVQSITNEFKNMGEQLHTTNSELMTGAEEVLRAGYDMNTAKQMMEASVIGAKISGQTTAEVTEQLIAIKNAFDMDGSQMNNVVDIISKMDDTSATSFKEIADAIQRTAYSAQQAGTPLENLVSYITTVSEKTRRSADTIGESFKSIYSRYSNIKLGNLDEDGKSINDVETALARVNVKLRDNKDSFREFDDVLEEYVAKYQKGLVSEVDHLAVVNTLAGSRQKETLLALIENFDKVTEHQNAMVEATGSAKQKFDEVYSESLQAKLGDLQRSFEGLYESMLNSSMLGNSITTLTGFINGISNVTNTLGLMPTTITAVVGALTVFNSKFNESVSTMTHFTPIVGTWQTNLKNTEQSLIKQATSLRENITSLKGYNDAIVTGVDGIGRFGPAVANAGTKLGKLNMDLALTNVKLVAVKVSTIALQAVMSMGLSLAITTLISVVGKAIGSLSNLGKELKEFNDEYSNIGKDGGDFSYLLSKYSELEKKLKTVKSGTIEYNETEKELDGIQQTLATSYGEKISMLESDTEAKKLNLEATKKLNEEELILAQGNAKETFNKNNISNTDDVDKAIKRYSEAYKILDEFNEKDNTHILANLSESMGLDAGFLETLRTGGDLLPIVKENAEESTAQLEALYTATGVMSQTDSKWIDAHEKLGEVLGYTNDTINGTTNLIDSLNNSDTTSGIDAITESAEEAQGAIDELNKVLGGLKDTNDIIQQAIDEFNQYGELTEDTYDKILSNGTPEMVVALQDSNTFLETYNRLLQEGLTSEEAQRKAIIAKANEILNTGNVTADVVNQNAKNYGIDTQNHANATNSKIENSILYTNQSSKAVADMTTNNGKNYEIDEGNLRGSIRDKLSATDSFANGAMNGVATFVTSAGQNYVTDANNFVNQTNVKIRAMEMLQATLDSFASNKIEFGGGRGILNPPESITINKTGGMSPGNYAYGSGGYVGGSANAVNSGVGHGANSSTGGSGSTASSNSATQKEVANMEKIEKRYYYLTKAVEKYSNELDKNKLLQETANDKDKIKLMQEEIALYEKQRQAVIALNNEQKKEAEELKKTLYGGGFRFDTNGDIKDIGGEFARKVAKANSISNPEEKEKYIEFVKKMEDATERYTELIKDLIPKQEQEWLSLGNTISSVKDEIKAVYKEQIDDISSKEKEIADVVEYYAQKQYEAKKEKVEKELELERKRIEGIKESLSKEKELYNKNIEEDDYNANLAKERNKLAEIQSEIDRLSQDSSARGKSLLAQALNEYETQQQVISDMVKKNQQDATNDRFDSEMEMIDKELETSEEKFNNLLEELDKNLEEFLKPENINKLIQEGLTSGMITVGDTVMNLENAFASMLTQTEYGIISVTNQTSEWINGLKEVKSLYGSINSIMQNAGVNVNLPSGNTRNVSITTGDLIINGSVNEGMIPEIQDMLKQQADEIYKNIYNKLNYN